MPAKTAVIDDAGGSDALFQLQRRAVSVSEHDDSRRAFLAGGVGAAAGAAISADASAQSAMIINDPAVVREIEVEFAGYDRALGANDVAALNGYFFESPFTIRYGIAENLYGYSEIQAYRAAVVASGTGPKRERTVITAYLRPCPRCLDPPNRAKSAGRCKPGCDFRKAGGLSPPTSASSIRRPRAEQTGLSTRHPRPLWEPLPPATPPTRGRLRGRA